jgi:hypothetical protein
MKGIHADVGASGFWSEIWKKNLQTEASCPRFERRTYKQKRLVQDLKEEPTNRSVLSKIWKKNLQTEASCPRFERRTYKQKHLIQDLKEEPTNRSILSKVWKKSIQTEASCPRFERRAYKQKRLVQDSKEEHTNRSRRAKILLEWWGLFPWTVPIQFLASYAVERITATKLSDFHITQPVCLPI